VPKVTESHRAGRRAQILDAALVCFARYGLHQTTMQDIVKQAELSPGAIYLYFSGKDAIIAALADARHSREQMLFARASQCDSLQAALELLAREFLGQLQDPEERASRRVGIQVWAEALSNDNILPLMRRGVDEPRKLLAGMIRSAQDRGEVLANLDPDALARMLIALFQGLVLQQAWDEQLDLESYVATLRAILQPVVQ
jgi:AcrR family transcriptional regulator